MYHSVHAKFYILSIFQFFKERIGKINKLLSRKNNEKRKY